jgi:hypothetical protein
MSRIFVDREKIPYLAFMLPSQSFGLLDLLKGESAYYADVSNKVFSPLEEYKFLVHEGRGVILGIIYWGTSDVPDQLLFRLELDGMFQDWWEAKIYTSMGLGTTRLNQIGVYRHAAGDFAYYVFIPQEFREHCTVSLINVHATATPTLNYGGVWYALRR